MTRLLTPTLPRLPLVLRDIGDIWGIFNKQCQLSEVYRLHPTASEHIRSETKHLKRHMGHAPWHDMQLLQQSQSASGSEANINHSWENHYFHCAN